MNYILGILGMIGSVYMIKYREQVGDMFGEAEWMRKIGGVYVLVIIIAVIIFLGSISMVTGTEYIFLKPVLMLFPGFTRQPAAVDPFSM
jgi:hypothetical protein